MVTSNWQDLLTLLPKELVVLEISNLPRIKPEEGELNILKSQPLTLVA